MRLHVDEEVQGFNKEFENANDMKAAVATLIDENVIEVSIKKRAVKDNSHKKDEIDEAVERFIYQ
ncbi:MAG: hypothetical protein ACI4TK_18795 [Agathobacter sp.]